MKGKGFWVHENSMDMFVEVLAVYDVHPDYIKTKFRCWNKGYTGQPWMMLPKIFRGKVLKKDLPKWRRYVEQ